MRTVKPPCLIAIALSALLPACHVRPDIEDVVDVPAFEIVQKVQCEAADVVRRRHPNRALSKDLAKLEKDIKRLSADIKAKQAEAAKGDFGTREEELLDAAQAVKVQSLQIVQALQRVADSKATLDEKFTAVEALQAEKVRITKDQGKIEKARQVLQEVYRANAYLELLRARVKAKAYNEVNTFEDHKIVFTFEFQITENNNATSKGTVTWPILLGAFAGTFTMGYDVGDKKQRYTERKMITVSTFGELSDEHKTKCLGVDVAAPERRPSRYPINGNIGLETVVADYITVANNGSQFQSASESYSDKIQFQTTINGTLTPAIDIARKGGPAVKASADLAGDRKDLHSVKITLSGPGDGDKDGAVQPMLITSMPTVRVRADVIRLPPLN